MTDKELLEFAAKAIGLKYHAFVNDPFIGYGLNIGDLETPIWNPLTDDGDALRLAVKLNLNTRFDATENGPEVHSYAEWHDELSEVEIKEVYERDPYAATRRAITRAAAEIGRVSP